MRRAVLAGLLVAVAAAAAGTARYTLFDKYEVPERTDAVRAEETRLAALIATTQRWEGRALPECRVRVLGMDGATSYAWAECNVAAEAGDVPAGGWSAPYRIDGTAVREPADGAGYAPSVRELFPEALAKAILDHRDDLRPD